MSSLFQQLSQIKTTQKTASIGPPPTQQPFYLLDKQQNAIAPNLDVLYTMALISFEKLRAFMPDSSNLKDLSQRIFSETNKGKNRNLLTKQQNSTLSLSLRKFILYLTPFLKDEDCQKVMEYLLKNYHCEIFEPETLLIAFMHYWKDKVYSKLCKLVFEKAKVVPQSLSFLKELIKSKHTSSAQNKSKDKKNNFSESISSSFMIKSVLYSQSVLQQIMLYTSESIKLQNNRDNQQDIQINLEDPEAVKNFKQDLQPIRLQAKGFLLQIFQYILGNSLEIHYKHIIRFCLESTSTKKFNTPQIFSMTMILISQIVLLKAVSIGTVDNLLRRLYKAITETDFEQNKNEILSKFYKLVLIVWQREPEAINLKLIQSLIQDQQFQEFLSNINCSLFMVFRRIFNLYCGLIDNSQLQHEFNFQDALQLLENIVLRIKDEPFVQQYYKQYFNDIFSTFCEVRNTDQENYIQLKNFVLQYLQFQLAQYFNRNINQSNLKIAKIIFGEKRVSENGVNLAILIRKVNHKENEMEEQPQQQSQDISQEEQSKQDLDLVQPSNHKTIIQLLTDMSISSKNGIINYKDQNTKAALLKLVNEYYQILKDPYEESEPTLTQRQKNVLLQNEQLMKNYTHQMFLRDLSLEDWTIPIKYLLRSQVVKDVPESKKWAQQALSLAVDKNYLLSNALYRELVRVCLDILSQASTTNKNYKITIRILNKLYSQLYQSALNNKSFLIEINNFCLKISRKILTPKNMGKYYKILNYHCKLLAVIIKVHLHIDVQSTYQYPLIHYEDVQRCYREVIQIFTIKELYLINIGLLQILSRNNIELKALNLLVKLIVESINNTEYKIPQFIDSVNKMLTFCQLLAFEISNKEEKKQKMQPSNPIMSIGRKVSKSFYGSITDKHRKFIIKKIVYFLSIFYKDQKFITLFNSFLEKQKQATFNMKKKKNIVIQMHSNIYQQIIALDDVLNNSKANLQLLKAITNIFPLQSRISLFIPLLPNNTLYRILSEQLAEHPHFDSKQLQKAAKILPDADNINYNWLSFIHQCFTRGHKINEQEMSSILNIREQKVQIQNHQDKVKADEIICKFICYTAQYCRQALLPVLQQSLQIIHNLCIEYNSMQTQQGFDSLLAISGRCVEALEDIIGDKIIAIFAMSIQIPRSQYLQQYFELICQHLSKPTLLQLIKSTYKTVENFSNYMSFLKIAVKQNFKESIIKILQKLYSRTIKHYLQEENFQKKNIQEVKALQQLQASIFVEMALLMKEDQLRKLLINFVAWAQNRQNSELDWPISFRKTIILNIFSSLSETLGTLFTNFYGFIFEGLLVDIKRISQRITSSNVITVKGKGRIKSIDEHSLVCWKYYLAQSLSCLTKLLQNDSQRQFLDVGKFEELSIILSDLFLINQLGEDYQPFIQNYLKPCLLSLNGYVKDEYQIKTLNFKILLHLKGQSYQRSISIYEYLHDLVNTIQDRFLIVMQDLGRLLKQAIQSRNQQVQKLAKAIIFKVRQLTGQDISTYI